MSNNIVKLLGDSVYSLGQTDTVEEQRGGLGKLSYGLVSESIVEQQRGGLGKLSYAGANPLAKISMFGEDDLTFVGGHFITTVGNTNAMNFAEAAKQVIEIHKPNLVQRFRNNFGQYAVAGAPRSSRTATRRTPTRRPTPTRTRTPTRRAAPKPAPRPTPRPSASRRVHLSKQTPYPPDTTAWKPASTTGAMALPQNRGIVKTSQIETGLPRTKVRQGNVATSVKQVERASAGKPVAKPRQRPTGPRRILPKGWLFNLIKIFDM